MYLHENSPGPFVTSSQASGHMPFMRRNVSAQEQLCRQYRLGFVAALIMSAAFIWFASMDSFAVIDAKGYPIRTPSVTAISDLPLATHKQHNQEVATLAPRSTAVPEATSDVENGPIDCDRSTVPGDRAELIAALMAIQPIHWKEARPPSETKWHYNELLRNLEEQVPCIIKARRALHAARETRDVARIFIDLGSRDLDSTRTFLARFPEASAFHIHCFEANPAFDRLYRSFASQSSQVRLTHHSAAFGVANTTLLLSDRSVGSSVVAEGRQQQGGTPVRVVDAAEFFVMDVLAEVQKRPDSYVVVKMDIEKMEFAVLHRLLRLGLLPLIDDLLLECHYNTNKRREQRNASHDIGLDDCKTLVSKLNEALNVPVVAGPPHDSMMGRPFVAVLWNSIKTARSSGYVGAHGGFFPT